MLHRDGVTRAGPADKAWEALRDLAIDADITVTELAVYEEAGGLRHDAGRVALGSTSS